LQCSAVEPAQFEIEIGIEIQQGIDFEALAD